MKDVNVIERLRAAVAIHGTQQAVAQHFGMSAVYLSDIITGKKQPGKKVLDAIGVERVVTYREKEQPE